MADILSPAPAPGPSPTPEDSVSGGGDCDGQQDTVTALAVCFACSSAAVIYLLFDKFYLSPGPLSKANINKQPLISGGQQSSSDNPMRINS